jgi:SnoaL-like domain
MTQREADTGLDFAALRLGIEHCDLTVMLDFYADDAELSIVNVETPRSLPFELHGKAEIAKHLRATFGQKTSHRVEREVIGEEQVAFQEACEYPDGSQIVVETTLEVRGGKIVRQTDLVAEVARAGAIPPDRLLSSELPTEKEDLG